MISLNTSVAAEHNNPLFGYTHLAPSPFTLKAGRIILGTDIAFGVTDFFQIGTNVVRDIFEIYNANAKIAVLDAERYAAALTFGYEHYNLRSFSTANPDLIVDAYQPGLVGAFALMSNLAFFSGANLNFAKISVPSGIDTSGFQHGAEFFSDVSFAYDPPKKSKGVGNVLSAGITYDFTYELFGLGISHHFPGFHVGLHYYPGASTRPILPIISGGEVVDL